MKFKIEQTEKELARLKKYLPGEISYNNGVASLYINESIGEGVIKCTSLDEGITALELEITLNDDTTISIDDIDKSTICFLYCMEGTAITSLVTKSTSYI